MRFQAVKGGNSDQRSVMSPFQGFFSCAHCFVGRCPTLFYIRLSAFSFFIAGRNLSHHHIITGSHAVKSIFCTGKFWGHFRLSRCIIHLSPRPLHRRGSPCAVHRVETDNYPSLHRPSPVERGWGRGLTEILPIFKTSI